MDRFFLDLGVVVVCAAALSWLALYLRQPIIVAYLLGGVLLGPHCLSLVKGVGFVDAVSRLGVTLLLFLAGLVLHPRRFRELLGPTVKVAAASSAAFLLVAALFARAWGFGGADSLFVGLALMFSSTILVVKLLPTTALHHRRMGAFCIAVLIAQDLAAIALIWLMGAAGLHSAWGVALMPLKGALLLAFAFVFEQHVLRRMMRRCERFHETLYLLALGWCMAIGMLARGLGFSLEVGAFIAGVALARSPIALFLSEGLKFLRDFFLVLFFFVLGAGLDPGIAGALILPSLVLGLLLVVVKPVFFELIFRTVGEKGEFAREAGVRLGQGSEFSLLIAVLARQHGFVSVTAAQFIQLTAVVTMIASSYLVIFNYPSPLGLAGELKQD